MTDSEILGKILGKLETLETDVKEIKAGQVEMREDIRELKADVLELKVDVKQVKEQVNTLYDWVDGIDIDVKNIKKTVI